MQSYLDQLFDFRKNQMLKKMKFTDFELERVLQKSEKNEVLLVTCRRHKLMGKLVLKKLNNLLNKKAFIANEINVGKKLKKSSISKLIHNWVEGEYTYLLFEYVDGKDLYDFLAENCFDPLPEKQARDIIKQIAKTLKYIHKAGFVHGDLKLENIMIEKKSLKVKLIDFGFSSEVSCKSLLSSYQGSLEYLSPEVLTKQPYQPCKSEVWSLGVILFTLLFGEFPFSEFERNQEFKGITVVFPSGVRVTSAVQDLLLKMLSVNTEERIELEDVLKHPWMDL